MGFPEGGIAFFDSGIGGLTVLNACQEGLPKEFFYYYGDNRHAPYGNLSKAEIERYVFPIFRKFERWRVGAAVVACNTVTAACIEELRKRFSFPIVGTEPAILPAAKRGGEIYVLSTRATFESERFRALLNRAERRYPHSVLRPFSCDDLAGKIERGLVRGDLDLDINNCLPEGKPNVVVLGCTHYGYVAEEISAFYGCEVVDGNEGVAKKLRSVLRETKLQGGEYATEEKKYEMRLPATTCAPKTGKTTTEKCFFQKKSRIIPPFCKASRGEIFFVGVNRNTNFTVYEQMFASKVGEKGHLSQFFSKKLKKYSKNS